MVSYNQNQDNFSSRFKSAFELSVTHILVTIIYLIIAVIVAVILVSIGGSSGLFLGILVGFVLAWIGILASFIFTISNSKYFSSKLGIFESMKFAFELEIELFGIALLVVIVSGLILQFSITLAFLIAGIFYVVFPFLSFYFVLIWIFENKDNLQIGKQFYRSQYSNYRNQYNQTNSQFDANPYISSQKVNYGNPQNNVNQGILSQNDTQATNLYNEDRESDINEKNSCPNCGYVLKPNSAFCTNCGAKMEIEGNKPSIKEKNYCHNCGYTLKPDSAFCPNCGMKAETE